LRPRLGCGQGKRTPSRQAGGQPLDANAHSESTLRPIPASCRPDTIRDVHYGNILIEEAAVGQAVDQTRALHAHKNLDCPEQVRAAVGHKDFNGMCDDLGSFLVLIAVGVGLDPADFRERLETCGGGVW